MVLRFALLAVLLVGCGESVKLIDPPIELASKDAGGSSGGTPSITLGIFSEQFFTTLEAGDELPIVAGFQGGDWVMPAIRANVLAGSVTAESNVTLVNGGEVVGRLDAAQDRLQPTAEGATEIVGLPVPIRRDSMQPIDNLYGQRARIFMALVDAQGQRAETTVEVVLVED